MTETLVGQVIGTFIACALSNFGYQWFTEKDWLTAFERTYFQASALATLLLGAAAGSLLIALRPLFS